jgi:(1->4)-alpha-D-glucan 1-alpha-D-glucosylmutase
MSDQGAARRPAPHPPASHLPAPGRPVPAGTYRLQLSAAFTFADAREVVGYLDALGASHAYLSPVLQAAPGSSHGYDIVDHTAISAELGGEDGLRSLVARLREAGLAAVADIVPNHMAVPVPEYLNRPLWSVLRDGPDSPCARWFDIDWDAQDRTVLMPVLGRRIAECLDAGEITVDPDGGPGPGPVVRYYDHVLPVRPGTEKLPLPELLDAQWYRLAYWRVADEELNYRRFFDIDTLAGVRVEVPEVFDESHRLVASLVRDGTLDGLRVDHPDGLADPRGYLLRLADTTAGSWVVVEKILERDEELPADWACAGTTGYDAARVVGGVFVDPAGAGPLTACYTRFTGAPAEFAEVAAEAKRQVLTVGLRAEVRRLADLLVQICREDVRLHDHTAGALTDALIELLVAFPVYRTYLVPPADREPPAPAVAVLDQAAGTARGRLPEELHPTLELVRDLALGRHGTDGPRAEFLVRFQQTSSPAMAKGLEDTAFYRWSRLAALNEVGADPAAFGAEPAEFHEFCARLQRDWPLTLTGLSTHDSKRSEDVRARLAVLAELPTEWERAVTGWSERARALLAADGVAVDLLDRETEYLFWQTLAGAWPIEPERLVEYLRKAVREAKRRTFWTAPDEAYETVVFTLAERVLADAGLRADVAAFVARTAPFARVNSLGQKLLQLAMPGVPDVYQGTELVSLTLVDPDNRRPVDYRRRTDLLARLDAGQPVPDGDLADAEKLLVTSRTLRLRRRHPEWFGASAGYQPLTAGGAAARSVLGFARSGTVLAVATRLPVALRAAGGWGDTFLDLPEPPGGGWRDLFTGAVHPAGKVPVAAVLHRLPVALLAGTGAAG